MEVLTIILVVPILAAIASAGTIIEEELMWRQNHHKK